MESELTESSTRGSEQASLAQPMEDVQSLGHGNPTSTEQLSESQSEPRKTRASGSSDPGRKRRPPVSVTPIACTSCKKARAKCDGARPACRRCVSRNAEQECHYELHAKTAKEQMMREIQRLQRKTEELIEENEGLGETNSWVEQIMASLKENGHASEIINRLKRGDSHEGIARWLRHPEVSALQSVSPTTARIINQAIERIHHDYGENPDPLCWTRVPRMPALVEHLINLYLSWVHPVHMLFDQELFMQSYHASSNEHCSASMVNVICAMACLLIQNPDVVGNNGRGDFASLRKHFMGEAKLWLERDLDYSKMTTIQTYAIMFLVELGCGHGLLASSHLRLAVENLLVDRSFLEQASSTEEVAAWGILTLHTVWSGFTYQKPSAPIPTYGSPFEKKVREQKDDVVWHRYTDPYDEDDEYRLSHGLETASAHAKLFRIVHENILVYCGIRGRVSAEVLFPLYERYLAWKDGLSANLSVLEGDPLPHVLFLHIQYHTALVHLLQPLIEVAQDEVTRQSLCRILLTHAHVGVSLLQQYEDMYPNHILTPLQIFCLVHICDAIIKFDSRESFKSESAEFCLETLEALHISYPLADPLQKIFRDSVRESKVSISEDLDKSLEALTHITPDDLLDACTRPTYNQPISQIKASMNFGLAKSFLEMVGQLAEGSGRAKGKQRVPRQMDIGSMLNES